MMDRDAFADLYLHFEDRQAWLNERLSAMTFTEYLAFVDYVFSETDFAAEAKDGREFFRVKGLLLAIARKELEVGHFLAWPTAEQRASSQRAAQTYFDLAKGFYPEAMRPALDAGWAASQEHAATYGASSPLFGIVTQDAVFRDG